jgi:hypothetical protein
MLTIEFNGAGPYLHAEKGPVGFIKKMELGFQFRPARETGFIITKFTIDRSGVKENLNKGEQQFVEFEP